MEAELTEAVSITIRYDTKYDIGQTRRERAARFNHPCPILEVKPYAVPLWVRFWSLRRVKPSNDIPIDFGDIYHMAMVSGDLIDVDECAIIFAMDDIYRKSARIVASENEALNKRHKNKG